MLESTHKRGSNNGAHKNAANYGRRILYHGIWQHAKKKQQVTALADIRRILQECTVMNVGMMDFESGFPYVVPLNLWIPDERKW